MLKMELSFPEEVLEHVFSFLQLDGDQNSISLVCKSWFEIKRNVEIGIATWWVKMWGYPAKACYQAFYA